eukprot:NODE_4_length_77007_cov_1.156642.p41 type:complete len:266 gc:universal NODE_4_length_77007_cov_1.156642:63129-62332(-)
MGSLSEEIGISDAEKRYWHISEEVKKLKHEDPHKKQIRMLEKELEQITQKQHPLLQYYEKLLDKNRIDQIRESEETFKNISEEAVKTATNMKDYIEADFIRISDSIFGNFMEVLNERKKIIETDRNQNSVTSFGRKDPGKISNDTNMPYSKMILNDSETPEEILERLANSKKKPLGRPGEKLKPSEVDYDINIMRNHVTYKPEKPKRTNKRPRRERIVEREDIYSDDEVTRPVDDESRRGNTNRPRRRARRQEFRENYSDEFSDE